MCWSFFHDGLNSAVGKMSNVDIVSPNSSLPLEEEEEKEDGPGFSSNSPFNHEFVAAPPSLPRKPRNAHCHSFRNPRNDTAKRRIFKILKDIHREKKRMESKWGSIRLVGFLG